MSEMNETVGTHVVRELPADVWVKLVQADVVRFEEFLAQAAADIGDGQTAARTLVLPAGLAADFDAFLESALTPAA